MEHIIFYHKKQRYYRRCPHCGHILCARESGDEKWLGNLNTMLYYYDQFTCCHLFKMSEAYRIKCCCCHFSHQEMKWLSKIDNINLLADELCIKERRDDE